MKYKLIKDNTYNGIHTPEGTVFWTEGNMLFIQHPESRITTTISGNLVILFEIAKDNTEWFEPVEEKKSMAERITEQLPYGPVEVADVQKALRRADIVDAPREEDITDEMADAFWRDWKASGDIANYCDVKKALQNFARMWREKRGKG